MTSPWAVPIFTNLTIPTTAGPGQARIVLASQLPPPLDTYTFLEPSFGGGPYSYAAAIIFYNDGGDDSYTYIATVDDVGATGVIVWHVGEVDTGAVVERAAGEPQVFELARQLGAASHRFLYGDNGIIRMENELIIRANNVFVELLVTGELQLQPVTDMLLVVPGDTKYNGVVVYYDYARITQAASATLVLGLADAAIAGTLTNVNTTEANTQYKITGIFDFANVVGGNANCNGRLYIDGAVQTRNAVWNGTTGNGRATLTYVWEGVLAATGAHTFELFANKSAAVGNLQVILTNTQITTELSVS